MTRLRSDAAGSVEDLSAVLHHNNFETMLRNARITRNWPDCREKVAEASRQAHMALYERALQEISDEQRDQILEILRPYCDEIFYSVPARDDEPAEFYARGDERCGPPVPSVGRTH
jgi:hypothetical protein